MSVLIFTLVLCVEYAASDPCAVADTTWATDDIIDILEDIPDYATCQYSCASLSQAQCNYFTWYNAHHGESPLTCVFFDTTSGEIPCTNCISGPAICPTRDLFFIGDSLLLELPSFTPAVCTLASYPERGIQYAVSGTAQDRSLICGGRKADGSLLSSCWSLQGNSWQKEESITIARSGAAASGFAGGLMVTGGFGAEGYLSSSEVFKENSWAAGPSLPVAMEGHCQVQLEENVIVVGGYTGPMPSAAAFSLEGDSWISIGELRTPRGWHACSFRGTDLYVMGGFNGSYLSSTEILDLDTGLWRDGPDLPYPAYDGQAVHYDGQLYLIGGYGSDGEIVRLSDDGAAWEEVARTGGTGTRTWTPAPVISSDFIGC